MLTLPIVPGNNHSITFWKKLKFNFHLSISAKQKRIEFQIRWNWMVFLSSSSMSSFGWLPAAWCRLTKFAVLIKIIKLTRFLFCNYFNYVAKSTWGWFFSHFCSANYRLVQCLWATGRGAHPKMVSAESGRVCSPEKSHNVNLNEFSIFHFPLNKRFSADVKPIKHFHCTENTKNQKPENENQKKYRSRVQ